MSVQKSLSKALEDFRKVFGSSSIYGANETFCAPVQSISTGSFNIDDIIGVGGVPRGRIVQIAGRESSGKTLLALEIVKQAQKEGGLAYYIDAEFALDKKWLVSLGVDLDRLLISQPSTAIQAFELLLGRRKSNVPGILENQAFLDLGLSVIVLDSIAALIPPQEDDSDIGKSNIALLARFLPPVLRNLTPLLAKTNVCFIVINQLRLDPNVMFGNPERSPGGRALKHHCSVMLNVAPVSGYDIIENGVHIGHKIKVRVDKNKVAPPGGSAEVMINVLKGIDVKSELASYSIRKNIIRKVSDRIYEYKNYRWNGMKAIEDEIASNNKLVESLLNDINLCREKEKQKRESHQWIEESDINVGDFIRENFDDMKEVNIQEQSEMNMQEQDVQKQLDDIIESSQSTEIVKAVDLDSLSRNELIQKLRDKGVTKYLNNLSKKELIDLLTKENQT